jgi:outer membrane protein OmpA-like peptidoglycan-associated protein
LNIVRGPWSTLSQRVLTLMAVLCLVLSAALPARAQSGYFYLDRAQISGAPDDGFTVFRPYVSRGTRFYGTAALGYSVNTLRVETVTDNGAVQGQIQNPMAGQLILYPTVGVQLMSRLGASITLPVSVLNITGNDPQGKGVGTGGIGDHTSAVHDLRMDLRVRSFETDDGVSRFGGGFALFAPTGNATAFASDGQVTGWLFGSAEFDFKEFFLSGHIGPHFRPRRTLGGENGDLGIGSELRWAFGAYVPLREGKLRVGGELFGSTGLDDGAGAGGSNTIFAARNTALEWLAQARFQLEQDSSIYINAGIGTRLSIGYGAPDVRALISVGKSFELGDSNPVAPPPKVVVPKADDYDLDTDRDGYPDTVDKCPTVKEDKRPPDRTDGCPTTDQDADGLPDDVDSCPDKPEDKDGIADEDGCPEDDADNDTVPDQEDKCPIEPGPRNDDPEKNGCTTLTRVNENGEVELLQAIQFETGKAKIKEESFPILNEVETLMKARQELRIGVYGHTDNRGAPALNMKLSKERAAACMKYLVDKGVDPSRLESDGFGATKPLEDNASDAGRTKNRRVEFKILESK